MPQSIDDKLLYEIGFSTHDELKAFLQKVNDFYETLTPAESKAFQASMTDFVDAALSFNTKVSPQRLRAFLKARTPEDAEMVTGVWGNILRRPKKRPAPAKRKKGTAPAKGKKRPGTK